MKNRSALLAVATLAAASSAVAATTLNSGATFTFSGTNWSNGAPAAGNDGTISSDYTFAANIAVPTGVLSVTQTAGNGTSAGTNNWNYNGAAGSGFVFNLQGGSITVGSASGFFSNQITVNISGGSLTAQRLQLANNGTLNISGGTVNSTTYSVLFSTNGAAGSNILNLSGGSVTGGSTTTSLLQSTTITATIGGSAIVNGSSITSFGNTIANGSSTLNFLNNWTGSLNLNSSTDWSSALIGSGATLNGTDIDNTNINRFNIVGGTISLNAVPEPSTYGLMGAGALAGVAFVRRRRKTA